MPRPDESFGLHKKFKCGKPTLNEGETVYPIEMEGFPTSWAIAYIDQSPRHHHEGTWETYIVMDGALIVEYGSIVVEVPTNEVFKISPHRTHCACKYGEKTACVLVLCTPPFNPKDYFLATDQRPIRFQHEQFD